MNAFNVGDVGAFLGGQVEIQRVAESGGQSKLTNEAIIDRCFVELTRSAFRRTRIDEAAATDLRRKLSTAVAARDPISFTVPFGGYKNCHAPSFPGPDWAEVFNMNYLARYALPVTQYYEPGVVVQYTYSSGVMDLVSNIPLSACATYMAQFRSLLEIFAEHLPENLQLTDVDISSHYGPGEQMTELRRNYEHNLAHWVDKLPEAERERRIRSAQRNLMRNGVVDLSSLSDSEWNERCVDAAMWCEALDGLTLRRQFNKYAGSVQLVFVRGPSLSVHVGSCDTSAQHFWSGCGVLERGKRQLRQRIVSGDRLSAFRRDGSVVDVSAASIFSSISPSFETIAVLLASEHSSGGAP